jgi:hypothetical protein
MSPSQPALAKRTTDLACPSSANSLDLSIIHLYYICIVFLSSVGEMARQIGVMSNIDLPASGQPEKTVEVWFCINFGA